MPRVVDHAERRAQLARAVWQIAREEGVGALSVRRVGEAAGWSGGAVQYYFPTKNALLQHAFGLVKERTLSRIHDVTRGKPEGEALRAAVMSLLPTDADVSAESEIWFAFMGLALGEPGLRSMAEEGHRAIVAELRQRVVRAQQAGVVHPDHDPDDITAELLAVCDGLCVQQLYRPRDLSGVRITRIMHKRLAGLAARPGE